MLASDLVPIDSIKPWVDNPRKNAHAVARVRAALDEFGWVRPIIVNTHPKARNEIIVGHTARLAALERGDTEVPVRFVKLTPAKAHAAALADNKLGEISRWDDDLLAEIMKQGIVGLDDMKTAGFSDEELASLGKPLVPPDEAANTRSAKRGDLWLAGPHRLVCGDPTDEKILAHVNDKDTPALLVREPRWVDVIVQQWEQITGRKATRRKAA